MPALDVWREAMFRFLWRPAEPTPIPDPFHSVNAAIYEQPRFQAIRGRFGRQPEDRERAMAELQDRPDDEILNGYFLDLAKEIVSINHQLPHFLRYIPLRKIARTLNLRTFVETGTLRCDGCKFLENQFDALYTIDIDPWCYENALKVAGDRGRIHPMLGDSADVLPSLVPQLGPSLFYLDGHCTPTPTLAGYGAMQSPKHGQTPILQELEAVSVGSKTSQHAIIVDDLACFEHSDRTGYPSIERMQEAFNTLFPRHRCTIAYGLFALLPKDAPRIQILGMEL
jgi:hypothetical protein